MTTCRTRFLAKALCILPLVLAGTLAQAATSGVRDDAGFFSESAKSTATRVLAEIEKESKRDLVIETYQEIPSDVRAGIDLRDKTAVKGLFETWSARRAKELGVQGVYVVMTREPAHLQIAVGNATQRQAFTPSDRDRLASTMLERLRAKKHDDALIAGVNFVRNTLVAHRTSAAKTTTRPQTSPNVPAVTASPSEGGASARSFSWFGVLVPILLVGLVILIVVRLLGRLFGRGASGGMTPGMGGGFMQSMLGGLFGAAAGMWLYNLFSGPGTTAWGSDATPGSDTPYDSGSSGQDTDYSSSGGDFGGDSGGGDLGGGGGGDF